MVRSPPISDCDYINFLVAAQCDVSCVKAAECFSGNGLVITHDAFNRFLTRQSLTPETLWAECNWRDKSAHFRRDKSAHLLTFTHALEGSGNAEDGGLSRDT